jgi:hypothetical protein
MNSSSWLPRANSSGMPKLARYPGIRPLRIPHYPRIKHGAVNRYSSQSRRYSIRRNGNLGMICLPSRVSSGESSGEKSEGERSRRRDKQNGGFVGGAFRKPKERRERRERARAGRAGRWGERRRRQGGSSGGQNKRVTITKYRGIERAAVSPTVSHVAGS